MPRSAKRKAANDGNTAHAPKRESRPRRATASYNANKAEAPAQASEKMPPDGAKRATRMRRGRPSKKWSEPFVITSDKSPLVDIDLKLFSNPKSWTCLDEDEKREILSLLPAGTHPNPDGNPEDPESQIEPLPYEFLRYSIPWRDAVRQFQDDLQNGRYDPEWQRQAHEAVEERAAGKFDKWKEEQFEEFWGQKQKIDRGVIAGESSKIKLETLVENDLIQVGDIWKFTRVVRRGKEKILVEKEVKVIGSDGKLLTFAIPSGQRLLLCGVTNDIATKTSPHGIPDSRTTEVKLEPTQPAVESAIISTDSRAVPTSSDPGDAASAKSGNSGKCFQTGNLMSTLQQFVSEMEADGPHENTLDEQPAKTMEAEIVTNPKDVHHTNASDFSITTRNHFIKILEEISSDSESELSDLHTEFDYSNLDLAWDTFRFQLDSKSQTAERAIPDTQESGSSIELNTHKITAESVPVDLPKETSPMGNTLEISKAIKSDVSAADPEENQKDGESKAFEHITKASDGTEPESNGQPQIRDVVFRGVRGPTSLHNKILEIDGRIKNPPNGNAWKDFRCYRNNQDIGSLWDIRQSWYLRGR
ncbi:hypothetical protein CPC735_012970 [Coccidioides posadasii C735 delta SOWgp]|uniref:DEUBAD domain-containing protein n=1 Tax=Coccidioides posadasii (strain C735) TaxID=222929 RepID=C5NZT6_COCP7|nr:hypothetical protein CPC735_012970 [Coccidioides posadasii C735 delta SOWgp]EER29979.1 hypothetical protein CPC735_012970 [Coccidioides posadasii C735 delta SOWgp]|eukprot:XP_003072124.1 hypothetical protein CPC735_012970 [Coccidioides posadasii C735 delta SOWgp]